MQLLRGFAHSVRRSAETAGRGSLSLLTRWPGFGALVAVACLIGSPQAATAQGQPGPAPLISRASDVTFSLLATAPFGANYRGTQVRRFLDEDGRMVQVREAITVLGDGTKDSPFQLEFQDLVGTQLGTVERSKWQVRYQVHAGLLHHHGTFRLRDAALAAQNYQIVDFGAFPRSGRVVRRTVIFPRRLDKGIWVLDLDIETGVPLYSAEFDNRGVLIGDVEIQSFSPTLSPTDVATFVAWQPRLVVNNLPATTSMTRLPWSVAQTVRIAGNLTEYRQSVTQVTQDPVNGDSTLVMGFSDGVDEFFVTQSIAAGNPFPAITIPGKIATGKEHVIASYSDPALRAYVFHEQGLTFQVIGRNSLTRLKGVAWELCRQVAQK